MFSTRHQAQISTGESCQKKSRRRFTAVILLARRSFPSRSLLRECFRRRRYWKIAWECSCLLQIDAASLRFDQSPQRRGYTRKALVVQLLRRVGGAVVVGVAEVGGVGEHQRGVAVAPEPDVVAAAGVFKHRRDGGAAGRDRRAAAAEGVDRVAGQAAAGGVA